MIRTLFSLLLAIALTGCTSKQSSSVKTLRINQKREIIDLARVADTVFYIFPNHEVPLISNINKLLFAEQCMVIKDQSFINNRPIFSINYNGEFEKQYGDIGRGPQEYLSAFDIALHNSKKALYIYDRDRQTLLTFDLVKGDLTEKIPFPFYRLQLIAWKPNMIASLNDEEGGPELSIRDLQKNKNLLERYTHNEITDIEIPKVFARQHDTLLFLRPASDTLQIVEENQVKPYLHVDFGKYAIDQTFKQLEGDALKRQYMNNNRLCLLTEVFADNNILLFNYLQQNKTHHLLIENNNVKLHAEKFQYEGEDLPKPIGLWKNHLVFCLFPEMHPNKISPTHKNFYLAFFKINTNP